MTIEGISRKMYIQEDYMSLVVRKPVFGISTRSDTNRAVHSQKMAKGLKFPI